MPFSDPRVSSHRRILTGQVCMLQQYLGVMCPEEQLSLGRGLRYSRLEGGVTFFHGGRR